MLYLSNIKNLNFNIYTIYTGDKHTMHKNQDDHNTLIIKCEKKKRKMWMIVISFQLYYTIQFVFYN